jgi:hypothetical protein
MNRREFLVRATIGGVTVPLLITEIGCSEDDGNGGPGPDSETFVSTNVQGHTHTITISDGDLTAGGDHSYTSSSTGHTHQVNLDAQQIDNLSVGCIVTQVSSNTDNHTHTWQILFADLVTDVLTTSQPDANDHSHTLTVAAEDLTGVPAAHSIPTSPPDVGASHTHVVALEVADYQALQNCNSVIKTSSTVSGHFHTFQIQRA